MHAALSVPRVHHPRNHILGRFEASTCMVVVDRPKGPHFRTVGRAKGLKVWLLPEEALYLLERGSLDIRWPVSVNSDGEDSGNGELGGEGLTTSGRDDVEESKEGDIDGTMSEEEEGIPMSLQGAYTAFLGMGPDGPDKLTLEQYIVYTSLKRLGYIVMRAKGGNEILQVDVLENGVHETLQAYTKRGLFSHLWEGLFGSRYPSDSGRLSAIGSLVKPGLYRSYGAFDAFPIKLTKKLKPTKPRFQMIYTSCYSLTYLASQQLRTQLPQTLL